MAKRETSDREIQTVNASDVGTLPGEIVNGAGDVASDMPGIISPANFAVPAVENPFQDDFGAFTSGFFLPRLQLEGSSSKLVKSRKVQPGNYVVISGKDQVQILGEQFDLLVLTYRSKALDLTDTKNVIASFDKESVEFKKIVAASQARSKGYLYGLEFLVWIPDMAADEKYATFFMGNPTMRVAAKNFGPILPPRKPGDKGGNGHATLKWEMLDNGENMWEAPVILPCSTPLRVYPSQESMATQMKMFVDPPKGPIREQVADEEAAEAGVGRDR